MILALFYNKVKHPQGISIHLLVSEMILCNLGHFPAFIGIIIIFYHFILYWSTVA